MFLKVESIGKGVSGQVSKRGNIALEIRARVSVLTLRRPTQLRKQAKTSDYIHYGAAATRRRRR